MLPTHEAPCCRGRWTSTGVRYECDDIKAGHWLRPRAGPPSQHQSWPGLSLSLGPSRRSAKSITPSRLLDEHRDDWAALWDKGGIELETDDHALQQTTNSTLYFLYMSTRSDWLHSTMVPSTIAAAGPKPHGYYGTTFWDQETFQAPPLMVHPKTPQALTSPFSSRPCDQSRRSYHLHQS